MRNSIVEMIFKDFFNKKTILITGHTGFIGSWLTLWLKLLNSKIIGLSLDYPTQPSLFQTLQLEKSIHHYFGNINDIQTIKKLLKKYNPDIVIHLAAQPLVKESYLSPVDTFQTNIMGTANLLESLRNSSVKSCIIMTSDKCYKNLESTRAYVEDDPLGGNDPYSASKGAAEIITHSYKKSFFETEQHTRISTVRAGNVIGGGDWASDRIIPDCVRHFSQNLPVFLRHPDSVRPFQYVLEPISGILKLAVKMWSDYSFADSWNFGPSHIRKPTKVKDVVDMVIKNWGSGEWKTSKTESSFKESKFLLLNSQKASKKLYWKSVFDLKTTISETVNWYKTFYDNPKEIVPYSENCILSYVKKAKEIKLMDM